ncbi:MAG: hypothetical protein IIC96_15465 [Chloroflexi bacterium]|nr:hypothetical protein [Chloroflexota bacterium]
MKRKESRGSHYRTDYPESNDQDWLCNVMVEQGTMGRRDCGRKGHP